MFVLRTIFRGWACGPCCPHLLNAIIQLSSRLVTRKSNSCICFGAPRIKCNATSPVLRGDGVFATIRRHNLKMFWFCLSRANYVAAQFQIGQAKCQCLKPTRRHTGANQTANRNEFIELHASFGVYSFEKPAEQLPWRD